MPTPCPVGTSSNSPGACSPAAPSRRSRKACPPARPSRRAPAIHSANGKAGPRATLPRPLPRPRRPQEGTGQGFPARKPKRASPGDPQREWKSRPARHASTPAAKAAPPAKTKPAANPASLKGAVKAAMPTAITPMKAALAETPPRGDEWLFEVKWDGVRAICFIEQESVRLVSRTGHSCEKQYPELSVIPHYLAASQAILDGEIAALDEKGAARFELIQPRIAQSDANAVSHMARSRPVVYFAFDLLYLNGYDLRQVALIERKQLLESILTPTAVMRYSEHFHRAHV